MIQNVKTIVTLLTKRPITETDALAVNSMDDYKHLEIVNGEWVGLEDRAEEMTGEEHGRIEFMLILAIGNHVMANNLGMVYPGDTDFVLDGDPGDIRLKRQPDIAFVAAKNVKSTSGYYFQAPDLAVEIVSPSQSYPEMRDKVNEYTRFGTQQVWLVLPRSQQVEVHSPDRTARTYDADDTIPGGDLLPGFSLHVAAIFES